MARLLIFGFGYLAAAVAKAWLAADSVGEIGIIAVVRDPAKRPELVQPGYQVIANHGEALDEAVARADAVLTTAPPDEQGCPGRRAMQEALIQHRSKWIGYISTTGVYGNRDGGWVTEDSSLNASSLVGARRVAAEQAWLDLSQSQALTVQIFRLPAIYGPGRSTLERLRQGRAQLLRKPGQVFNRIHVEDAASGLLASWRRPRAGGIYNLCDDDPSSADAVLRATAERLNLPLPPETSLDDPSVSEAMRRFYLDHKRVANARAKAELGWRPQYPTWREGLEALLNGEDS